MFKTIEDRREYQKGWMYRKRHGMVTRLHPIIGYDKKIYDKQYNKKKLEKKKEIRSIILGDLCVICDHDKRLIGHRKDGKKHKPFENMGVEEYKKELETNHYVLICFRCHKHVHWCMKYLKMTWEDIIVRLI